MDSPNFIGLYPGGASEDYCDRMVEKFKEIKKVSSGTKGEITNGPKNRKDLSYLFERDAPELAAETNQILDICLDDYMDKFPSLGILGFYSTHVKVQETPPKGGFHMWHAENAIRNGSSHRNLVWCIYLNDVPEGEGETEFLEYGVKVAPQRGLVTFFPSSWTHTHRGNPVYTHEKYIATGWDYLDGNS